MAKFTRITQNAAVLDAPTSQSTPSRVPPTALSAPDPAMPTSPVAPDPANADDAARQAMLARLAKARAIRLAKHAAAQGEAMPESNGATVTADVTDAVEIVPVPPIPNVDEPDLVPDRVIEFQPTPAAYIQTAPPAIQFVPSVGLLTKFFPGYKPRGVYYQVAMRLRDRIMGGTPADPNVMEGWLRKMALGVDKAEELRAIAIQTVRELGADLSEDPTWEEVEEASKKVAEFKQTNMFRRHPTLGCYVESRIIKSMLKENVNIVFGKDRFGKTNKGAKSYLAERVFVDPDVIPLDNGRADVQRPNGVHLFIGHPNGPQGKQSTLTHYEYIEQPTLRFTIRVFEDCLTDAMWGPLWESAQENGQGSLRSQGFGRFDLVEWDGPHPVRGE